MSGFVIPKNAPDKDGAYAYLDAMLDKSAQEAFAVDMGYNPTVTNAVVAPDLNKRIGFTPDEIKKLVDLDYDYMNKNDVDFKELVGQGLQGLTAQGCTTHATRAGDFRRALRGRRQEHCHDRCRDQNPPRALDPLGRVADRAGDVSSSVSA